MALDPLEACTAVELPAVAVRSWVLELVTILEVAVLDCWMVLVLIIEEPVTVTLELPEFVAEDKAEVETPPELPVLVVDCGTASVVLVVACCPLPVRLVLTIWLEVVVNKIDEVATLYEVALELLA